MTDPGVDCRQFDEASWLLLSDELDAGSRDEWHRHLAGCPQCARILAERRHVLDIYDGVVTTGDPSVEQLPVAPPRPRRSAFRTLSAAAAALALVAVGALAGYALTRKDATQPPGDAARRLSDLEVQLVEARLVQPTAAERLKAASAGVALASRDLRMLDSLLDALETDASPNVRMAIVDALYTVETASPIQQRFDQLVEAQPLPMLQIALIHLAADRRLTDTIPVLERIAVEPGDESVRERARWALGVLRGPI